MKIRGKVSGAASVGVDAVLRVSIVEVTNDTLNVLVHQEKSELTSFPIEYEIEFDEKCLENSNSAYLIEARMENYDNTEPESYTETRCPILDASRSVMTNIDLELTWITK